MRSSGLVSSRCFRSGCLQRSIWISPQRLTIHRSLTPSRKWITSRHKSSVSKTPRQIATHDASTSTNSTPDHRQLGKALDLFRPTPASPGSVLFGPAGTHILLKLQEFLRAQYVQFGFQEVITPIIYKQSLWEQSGHWEHYAKDMYEVVGRGATGRTAGKEQGDEEKFGMKAMNCPGHCLLYSTQPRSYRDLPIRYADFSPLHRNEVSGSLSGLTRVRRFHQDDGHIFCLPHQVKDEIKTCLHFLNSVYKVFGFEKYSLVLSTRPEEHYIGSVETWDNAEAQLKQALEESGLQWTLNPGDGAFYGPKIDIILHDQTGKAHQTATIQLDFQLPERMDLEYRPNKPQSTVEPQQHNDAAQPSRPVMIHRAVLGSLERFFALLIEHTGGKWPLWLSPRQVMLIPLSSDEVHHSKQEAYKIRTGDTASSEELQLLPPGSNLLGVQVSDDTSQSLGYRLQEAHSLHFNIKAIIGPRERQSGLLSVDFTGIPNYETCVPQALNALDFSDLAAHATKNPQRVSMHADQLRQLILILSSKFH